MKIKKIKSRSFLKLLLVLLALDLLILGAILTIPSKTNQIMSPSTPTPVSLSPSPTPMITYNKITGWKIYQNPYYPISIEFPADWHVDYVSNNPPTLSTEPSNEHPSSFGLFAVAPKGFPTPGIGSDGLIDFFVNKVDPSVNLYEWILTERPEYVRAGNIASFQTNNLDGYRIDFTQTTEIHKEQVNPQADPPMPVGYRSSDFYFKKGDLIYEIGAGKIDNADEFIASVDKIMATFKITR